RRVEDVQFLLADAVDMDAYLANRPSNYSRRIGDPNLSFGNVQFGAYIQDDIRPRRNLTLSLGARYEAQSHVGGAANIGPRFGVTWAPTASGQTTLRASTGIFYDWLPTGTYEQSLRDVVEGVRPQVVGRRVGSVPAAVEHDA